MGTVTLKRLRYAVNQFAVTLYIENEYTEG